MYYSLKLIVEGTETSSHYSSQQAGYYMALYSNALDVSKLNIIVIAHYVEIKSVDSGFVNIGY